MPYDLSENTLPVDFIVFWLGGPRAYLLGWLGERRMWNNETGICINEKRGKKLNKDKG